MLSPEEGVDGVELSDDVDDVEAFGDEEGADEVEATPLHATPSSGQKDALLEVAVAFTTRSVFLRSRRER